MKIKKVLVTLAAVIALALGGWLAWSLVSSDSDSAPKKEDKAPSTHLDAVKPTVELNIPASSLMLKSQGSFEISAIASDNNLIARVEYLVDGKVVATSTFPPFKVSIDVSDLPAGEHTLQAVAYDLVGNSGKSRVFTFVLHDDTVVPADSTSQSIVRQSSSQKLKMTGGVASNNGTGGNTGGDTGGGNGNGNGNGGDNGENPTTPWPDVAPAQICGNTSLLSGPTSAPTGAVIVPAGDNDPVNFDLPNTTYWFAPGVHTLGPTGLHQIIPGDNSTFIGAPNAVLDGQGINDYAFTQHGENITIKYLTIQNFDTPQNEGAVNHDSGVGWTIQFNTIQNNGGAGVFGGTDNTISYNCLKDNGQYGFQVYTNDPGGPQNVVLDHNEIVGNNQDDWEAQISGCGCTGGGKFWEANHVDVTNNYIHDNLSVGLWADTNDNDFLIEGNYIEGNDGQGIFYEIAYNMIVRNNTFIGNATVDGPGNPSFPTGAIYLSEAGGDSRVPARTDKIEIYDNQFVDNWSGVILWENADRFCNSPANTSTGTCTLVNPAANLTTCNDPNVAGGAIDQEPYYSDCRWKTQNVTVHDNIFSFNKSNIPGCAPNTSCGYQGIFSNTGTFPAWSPYMGDVIQDAITFNQNNTFSDNTYIGDWNFRAQSEDTLYNFALWQNAPFSQDAGSTYNGNDHMVVANYLDDNTATLEGGIGRWVDWFSTTPSRSNEQAHTGTYSLKVVQASNFWGLQLTGSGGVPVTPTPKTVGFWAKLGSGTTVGARMRLTWLNGSGGTLRTDDTFLNPFTSSWQQASQTVTPPVGTATVNVQFLHGSAGGTGTNGNIFYLDDIVIGDSQ